MWGAVALILVGGLAGAFVAPEGYWTPARALVAFAAAAAIVGLVALFVVRPARARGGLASPVVHAAKEAEPVPVESPRGPVRACMRCGSRDLALPGLRDGVWLGGGELQFLVCRRCNTRAPPLVFDTGEEYAAFVRELHEGGANGTR